MLPYNGNSVFKDPVWRGFIATQWVMIILTNVLNTQDQYVVFFMY